MFVVIIILVYQFGLITGKLKQQNSQVCISEIAINQWQKTLSVAEAICVDIQENQINTLKANYEELSKTADDKVEQWRKSYFWCEERIKNFNCL